MKTSLERSKKKNERREGRLEEEERMKDEDREQMQGRLGGREKDG